MDKLIINDMELELDLLDADVMEKYQELNEQILKEVNDKKAFEGLSEADHMRKQCRIIDRFFDGLFGDGTAGLLFDGKNNLGKRLEAFAEVTSYAANQEGRVQQISDKYMPQNSMNRAQRRAAERVKPKPKPSKVTRIPLEP